MITETDWRKASASSLVGVVDQIYDNEFVRLHQQYQSFIHSSIQNAQHDSLIVELVLVSKAGLYFVRYRLIFTFSKFSTFWNSVFSVNKNYPYTKDYERQGLGTMLVEDLVEFCILNSLHSIHLFTTLSCFKKLQFQNAHSDGKFYHLARTIQPTK